MRRALALALALACWAAPPVAADTAASFDAFVRNIGPLCVGAPSTACYATAFDHADADGDGAVSVAELEVVQADLRSWAAVHREALTAAERSGIALGLLIVDSLGLAWLVASYDVDGDGRLTPVELSADVTLDERPLPVLVRDPSAVDWTGIRGRLGAMAGFVLPPMGVP